MVALEQLAVNEEGTRCVIADIWASRMDTRFRCPGEGLKYPMEMDLDCMRCRRMLQESYRATSGGGGRDWRLEPP